MLPDQVEQADLVDLDLTGNWMQTSQHRRFGYAEPFRATATFSGTNFLELVWPDLGSVIPQI